MGRLTWFGIALVALLPFHLQVPAQSQECRVTVGTAPSPSPGWRMTSIGVWWNDLAGDIAVPGDPCPALPQVGPVLAKFAFEGSSEGFRSLVARDGNAVDGLQLLAGGFVSSTGPWWFDTNHDIFMDRQNGLHLVAFQEIRNLQPNVHARKVRLEHVAMRVRGAADLGREQLVWWMQTRPLGSSQFVNVALTGHPISLAPDWQWVFLDLSDPGAWTCLGANPQKAYMYGCAPMEAVLDDVNRNFGLILYPTSGAVTGTIEVDDVRIRYSLASH